MRARRRVTQPTREDLVFFIDRSVGKHSVAGPLRSAGLQVEIHDDHFPPDAKDQDWLPIVGKRGWIVITCDARIRYRRLELTAALNAGVGMFVIVSKNLTGPQIADILLASSKRIRRFILHNPKPFVARIYRDGTIRNLDV